MSRERGKVKKEVSHTAEGTILNSPHIAVIGHGYVGLPLAVEFEKKFPVVGFDINIAFVNERSLIFEWMGGYRRRLL